MPRRFRHVLAPAIGLAVLAACTPSGPGAVPAPTVSAVAQAPTAPATVLAAADPAELAVQASQTFFAAAPVVVAAPVDDVAAQLAAASYGVVLGVPVLLADQDLPNGLVDGELARLGTTTVLAVGDVSGLPVDGASPSARSASATPDPTAPVTVDVVEAPKGVAALSEVFGTTVAEGPAPVPQGGEVAALSALDATVPTVLTLAESADPAAEPQATAGSGTPDGAPAAGSDADATSLPARAETAPITGVTALSDGTASQVAAVGTARAAGAAVLVVPGGDPRASTQAIGALAASPPSAVVGLGPAYGTAEVLAWRAAAASTGAILPSGTQLVFQDAMLVALYGTPGSSALGVLGEQGIPETIARAQAHAATYEPYTDLTVVPSLEIIASIASAGAGDDGNYSAERPVAELRPLVDAAREAGLYVVLDLQPGRTDFLTQAKVYEELLLLPHVGLALDPEWRLEPDQVHLRQIGSVEVDEVNQVVTYVADLTRDNRLPQKLFILHQFRLSMITDRDRLDTSRSELAMMIHVDGQGSQPAKNDTWRALRASAPAVYWGWKNFYDEDSPMLTPEQTMRIDPPPNLVSYQ